MFSTLKMNDSLCDCEMNEMTDCESGEISPGRRQFLVGTMYSLVSAIAGALGITSALYLFGAPKHEHASQWADAGDIPHLRPAVPKKINFTRIRMDGWRNISEKDSAWLLRANDGTLTAFAPQCTHLGCAYHWDEKHDAFLCPCHGSIFSRTGQVTRGPATRPLDRYTVRREGDRVWLGPILKS